MVQLLSRYWSIYSHYCLPFRVRESISRNATACDDRAMFDLLNYPIVLSLVTLLILWLSARTGVFLQKRHRILESSRDDFSVILGATLTLLGLIIGFTFSMAIARYDQRKNLEEEEANAIGTEYVRADLLPAADAANVRAMLRQYLDERLLFYKVANIQMSQLPQINSVTGQLQTKLWNAVTGPAQAAPSPVISLAVSGMNDVLNSQGYTQAAWWNRIPLAAWILMMAIAIFCNVLVGYGSHETRRSLLFILPLLVSLSFMLIADIDSPRGGLIRVQPRNLTSLVQSLQGNRTRPSS